jgi:hypothetical protein
MTRRMRVAAVLAAALAAASLSGCASQMDGLAPVGGEGITALRIAATDVILAQQLTIRDAPACVQVDGDFSCIGSLTDGDLIQVTAPGPKLTDMTVIIGGDIVIYMGPVQQVLDEAARNRP